MNNNNRLNYLSQVSTHNYEDTTIASLEITCSREIPGEHADPLDDDGDCDGGVGPSVHDGDGGGCRN